VRRVAAFKTASVSARGLAGLLLGLLLALRLLGATGYMPAFERGGLTVVVCPGADDGTPLAIGTASHHHHGKKAHKHPNCPYASAGSLGSLASDFAILAAALVFVATFLVGRSFNFLERHRSHERPPSRGPPLPA
jgi:hypothetical protein